MGLKEEIKKRREPVEEFAEMAKISYTWARKVSARDEKPGPDARATIRAALEVCPVCRDCGVTTRLPVPPDEVLYAPAPPRRKAKRK